MKIGFRNYKGFGNKIVWFENKEITVLIGKNNSGKSSVLEVLKHFCINVYDSIPQSKHHSPKSDNRFTPEFFLESELDEFNLGASFSKTISGGGIPGSNHWQFGQRYLGFKYICRLNGNGSRLKSSITKIAYPDSFPGPKIEELRSEFYERLRPAPSPYKDFNFLSISAEREIKPERNNNAPMISSNGQGLINALQVFLNYENYSSNIVETSILNALNNVFKPDHKFTRIIPQLNIETSEWEIYLEENQNRIPLSNSGAGIKTVLLVLGMIFLMPEILSKPLHSFFFSFEELENNLHPSLLRRLLQLLKEFQHEHQFQLCLTTHSNVSIDFFSDEENVQIIHVKRNEYVSSLTTVRSLSDTRNILKDLDIKASDLLQSNGIIWVEGPSDRIYLNHLIRLWSNSSLKEGIHYQCLFYGGRLLAHFTAEEEPDLNLIDMLKINSNAAILIDSDIKRSGQQINSTKNRIIDEFTKMDAYSWITAGREVENYLPQELVAKQFNIKLSSSFNNFKSFFDVLDKSDSAKKLGSKYRNKKVELAHLLCEHGDISDWKNILDLNEKVSTLVEAIRKWNSIST